MSFLKLMYWIFISRVIAHLGPDRTVSFVWEKIILSQFHLHRNMKPTAANQLLIYIQGVQLISERNIGCKSVTYGISQLISFVQDLKRYNHTYFLQLTIVVPKPDYWWRTRSELRFLISWLIAFLGLQLWFYRIDGSCLMHGIISKTNCVISMSGNDGKCTYMCYHLLKQLSPKWVEQRWLHTPIIDPLGQMPKWYMYIIYTDIGTNMIYIDIAYRVYKRFPWHRASPLR